LGQRGREVSLSTHDEGMRVYRKKDLPVNLPGGELVDPSSQVESHFAKAMRLVDISTI